MHPHACRPPKHTRTRRGVVCQFRVMDGKVSKGDMVTMMNTRKQYQLDEIGVLAPHKVEVRSAQAGGKTSPGQPEAEHSL